MKIHVSANKLATFLAQPNFERRRAVVQGVMESRGKRFPPFYSALRNPARRFGLSGWRNTTELNQLIGAMAHRRGSIWLNTDSRVTAEAAKRLLSLASDLRRQDFKIVLPPPKTKAILSYPGIDVVVTPDLFVEGERHGVPLIGALRFYWAKESTYALGAKGAAFVAAMQYRWLVERAVAQPLPDAELCLVIECFQGRLTAAPASSAGLDELLRQGCADFLRHWSALGGQEAA